ncbi:hypothetical protein CP532_5415 [Ophiocordyceps camponoti-leonardi (nom. inval.)]|nr:hypothetical protein CP532_5415 [Ophiocordyceps camponoti-leonardi (nom. inval.)]
MKPLRLLLPAWVTSSAVLVAAFPISPQGPCDPFKVDQILLGKLGQEACCSYGRCKRDVVVSKIPTETGKGEQYP